VRASCTAAWPWTRFSRRVVGWAIDARQQAIWPLTPWVWNTRIELANAIFEYIEGFHSRRRLAGTLKVRKEPLTPARITSPLTPENRGRTKPSGKPGQARTDQTDGGNGRRNVR
jgi:hypothetical protein